VNLSPAADNRGITILNLTQSPVLRLNTANAYAGARNWAIGTNQYDFGDLVIWQSQAKGGDASGSSTGTPRLYINPSGNLVIGGTSAQAGYELTVYNDVYVVGDVGCATVTDHTPFPKDKQEAYAAVLSLTGKKGKVEHDKLHPFIASRGGRNLSALVSAQNEIIKDLMTRINALENIQ
jgi:hypothetical protein